MALGLTLTAGTVFGAEEGLPPLKAPHGELGPAFWEEQGWVVVLLAVVMLGAGVLLWALLRRPAPPPPVPAPESMARRALLSLRSRPEDAALVGEVSRIFRRYLQFAYALAPWELTTAELVGALQVRAADNPSLVGLISDFLRRCDEWKFAPGARGTKLAAAPTAVELLEQIEVHRLQIARAAASQPQAADLPPLLR